MSRCATNPAGLLPKRMPELPRTRAHLEEGLGKYLWSGFSLAARKNSRTLTLAGGDVPGATASVPWYSAGKPITAAGVLKILPPSLEDISQPVAATLPELAGSYAGTLSLQAILSHQTGLRVLAADLRGTPSEVWSFFRRIHPSDCQLSPGQAAYDPAGGWWLLGQWIEKRTGRPWSEFLEKQLLAPAGLPGLKFRPPAVPIRDRRAKQWVEGEAGSGPGAGLSGPASELALFYEKLSRRQILPEPTLTKMLRPARFGQSDATFGHIVDFGLGVILNRSRQGAACVPYEFGTTAGARSFGHGGVRSSIAFADPEAGFTAAVFLNGRVPESEHQPRMWNLLNLLRSELA